MVIVQSPAHNSADCSTSSSPVRGDSTSQLRQPPLLVCTQPTQAGGLQQQVPTHTVSAAAVVCCIHPSRASSFASIGSVQQGDLVPITEGSRDSACARNEAYHTSLPPGNCMEACSHDKETKGTHFDGNCRVSLFYCAGSWVDAFEGISCALTHADGCTGQAPAEA